MDGDEACYRCEGCGQMSRRSQLAKGAWGDPCCPACGSAHIVRHRTRMQQLQRTFFLFKVY
jgi:hypothetical protein